MSLWSKIGLASHKELNEMKEELQKERSLLREEIRELFREQQSSQAKILEDLKSTFEQTLTQLEARNEEDTKLLVSQINDVKSKLFKELFILNEQGHELSSKTDTLQEIVKIHWASTLIDYVDEIVEEIG